jgi:hypothetical protein
MHRKSSTLRRAAFICNVACCRTRKNTNEEIYALSTPHSREYEVSMNGRGSGCDGESQVSSFSYLHLVLTHFNILIRAPLYQAPLSSKTKEIPRPVEFFSTRVYVRM